MSEVETSTIAALSKHDTLTLHIKLICVDVHSLDIIYWVNITAWTQWVGKHELGW